MTRKVASGGRHRVLRRGQLPRRNLHRRRQVQVAVVGVTVEITAADEVLQVHRTKHDRSHEHSAFANATVDQPCTTRMSS